MIHQILHLDGSLNVTGTSPLPENWEELYRAEMAAICEGMCPVHKTSLMPVAASTVERRITGLCTDCRKFWGANLDTQECGWWLDRHPFTGQLINGLPGFMLPETP